MYMFCALGLGLTFRSNFLISIQPIPWTPLEFIKLKSLPYRRLGRSRNENQVFTEKWSAWEMRSPLPPHEISEALLEMHRLFYFNDTLLSADKYQINNGRAVDYIMTKLLACSLYRTKCSPEVGKTYFGTLPPCALLTKNFSRLPTQGFICCNPLPSRRRIQLSMFNRHFISWWSLLWVWVLGGWFPTVHVKCHFYVWIFLR